MEADEQASKRVAREEMRQNVSELVYVPAMHIHFKTSALLEFIFSFSQMNTLVYVGKELITNVSRAEL